MSEKIMETEVIDEEAVDGYRWTLEATRPGYMRVCMSGEPVHVGDDMPTPAARSYFAGAVESMRHHQKGSRLEDRIEAALDGLRGCCLDNDDEFERVLRAVVGAARPKGLDVLLDVDEGFVVLGSGPESIEFKLASADAYRLVRMLTKHGCRVRFEEQL